MLKIIALTAALSGPIFSNGLYDFMVDAKVIRTSKFFVSATLLASSIYSLGNQDKFASFFSHYASTIGLFAGLFFAAFEYDFYSKSTK